MAPPHPPPRLVTLDTDTWGVQICGAYLRIHNLHCGIVWTVETLPPTPRWWGLNCWHVVFTPTLSDTVTILNADGRDAGANFYARDIRTAVRLVIDHTRGLVPAEEPRRRRD